MSLTDPQHDYQNTEEKTKKKQGVPQAYVRYLSDVNINNMKLQKYFVIQKGCNHLFLTLRYWHTYHIETREYMYMGN